MQRLRRFEYHEPATIDEATGILAAAGDDARVLAGGTDLVIDMKTGRMRPSTVVNLKGITGLAGIEEAEGGVRIGALTKVTAVEASELVARRCPALNQAAAVLASPSVRVLATIGGNIGRASPASDLGPPLIVHGATVAVESPEGPREDLVEDLYVGPVTTTLASHEIITSVFIPATPRRFGSAHLKIGSRGGGTDISMVGVSAAMTLDADGSIVDAVIALASVAPTPMRAPDAEGALIGETPSEEVFAAAATAAAGECRPISDLRASASHRVALVRVLTTRALSAALEIARNGEVS
ncbi:xanthine dehydrogenase family protein subunit M [bacterium]|nr:xanthine dehydrogenase family protein subunit M [bacterium]